MNLVPLFEEALEFQNYNGSVLSNGKVAVYYIGRTRLADIFNDIEGSYPAENPRILDNLGMGPLYVNPAFDYEMVVYDAYNNELFSVKKYLASKGEHSTANVVVTPSENIAVSAWTIGDVQVYMPYLTGDVGKTYEGISPIVVNNDVNKISANHIPLGVQEPLYFVEDSESACIIGCSSQSEIPSAVSGKWEMASNAVISNSAEWAQGTVYTQGDYISIDDRVISVTGLTPVPSDTASTGLVAGVSADIVAMIPTALTGNYLTKESADTLYQPVGDYAYNSALSSKLDITALPQDLVHSAQLAAYQPVGDYLSASDSANFYPMTGNPSGFLTAHQSLQGYATEQWVEGKGYLTGVEIPESANWNEATQTVSANSATWGNGGGSANPQIPVTGINGIKISESGEQVVFEVSGDYYSAANISGFLVADDITGKLDASVYSANSGAFLTGILHNSTLSGDGTEDNPLGVIGGGSVDASAVVEYSSKPTATSAQVRAKNGDLYVPGYIYVSASQANRMNISPPTMEGYWNGSYYFILNPAGITASGLSAGSNGLFTNSLSSTTGSNGFDSSGTYHRLKVNSNSAYVSGNKYSFNLSETGAKTTWNSGYADFNDTGLSFSGDYNSKFNITTFSGGNPGIYMTGANSAVTLEISNSACRMLSGSSTLWDALNPTITYLWNGAGSTNTAMPFLLAGAPVTGAYDPLTGAAAAAHQQSMRVSATYSGFFAGAGTANKSVIEYDKIYNNGATGSATLSYSGITYKNSTGTWSLQDSIQKSEIEGNSATSAISAIAGSAIAVDTSNLLTVDDASAFYTTANESGFITGVDLSPYQTTADMTAYQIAGNYYSASNPSAFITQSEFSAYTASVIPTQLVATSADATGTNILYIVTGE